MLRTSAVTATAFASLLVAATASAQTTSAPSTAQPPAASAPAPSSAAPSSAPSSGAMAQPGSANTLQSAQQALQQGGYYKGKIDGKMGPHTRQAIRSFQQAKGLHASGHLDQKTLSALGVSS